MSLQRDCGSKPARAGGFGCYACVLAYAVNNRYQTFGTVSSDTSRSSQCYCEVRKQSSHKLFSFGVRRDILTGFHNAGGHAGVGAGGSRRDDVRRAALAGIHAGDRPAPLPSARISADEWAADIGVGVLDSGEPVITLRVVRRGGWNFKGPRNEGGRIDVCEGVSDGQRARFDLQ